MRSADLEPCLHDWQNSVRARCRSGNRILRTSFGLIVLGFLGFWELHLEKQGYSLLCLLICSDLKDLRAQCVLPNVSGVVEGPTVDPGVFLTAAHKH